MTDLEIIAKVNEVVTGSNFTKTLKVRKNEGDSFLIAVLGDGLDLYGCYGDTLYAKFNNKMVRLA